MPVLKGILQRAITSVTVEVAVTFPCELGRREMDVDGSQRRNRLPHMMTGVVERERCWLDGGGMEPNLASDAFGDRYAHFIDINRQSVRVPSHGTGANAQRVVVAREIMAATLGHGPTLAARAIERNIHGGEVERIAKPFAARAGIVR